MSGDTPRTDERWETLDRILRIGGFTADARGALDALRAEVEQTQEKLDAAEAIAWDWESGEAWIRLKRERDEARAEVERLKRERAEADAHGLELAGEIERLRALLDEAVIASDASSGERS